MSCKILTVNPNTTYQKLSILVDDFHAKCKKTTNLVLEYLEDKPKDVIKWTGYATGWPTALGYTVPAGVVNYSNFTRNAKNLLSAIEVPAKVRTAWMKVNHFIVEPSISTARRSVENLAFVVNSGTDAVDIASVFVNMNKTMLRNLHVTNFAASLIGCTSSAIQQVQDVNGLEKVDSKKVIHHGLATGRDVSYGTLGAAGLYFWWTATPVIPWVMLGCLTSGLFCTTALYFYDKAVDPYDKNLAHKTVKPIVV